MGWVVDWLELLGRWLHMITGVAWIGASFYFIWLDNHLEPPKDPQDDVNGVGGELWAVHGGGFYQARKFRGAPPAMPETLHWFKWEAYTTWLSGMFLLILIYWVGAEIYLIDPSVAELSVGQAVGLGAGYLLGGWILYDQLCKSPLGRNERALSAVLFVLLVLAAWSLCQLFGGRGAFIHYGALIGTIMVANVAHIIIPGQRRMVQALEAGQPINPADGLRGKQRSVHNTYLTLPVLFVMISNHYAVTYSGPWNWLILIGMTVSGALIRVWFVDRHKGNQSPMTLVLAAIALALTALLANGKLALPTRTAASASPTSAVADAPAAVTTETITGIILARCTGCHAAEPTWPGFVAPPAGVILETPADIEHDKDRVYEQTVRLRAMPIGNLTGITDQERELIATWYESL
ncbi:MAG: urate hydroxylase PuuD [Pseudomonadota bacterium]